VQQVRDKPRPYTGSARSSIRTLTRSIGYHLRQLSESWTDMMHRIIDKHGITHGQWRYLRELWEEDGLSQRELSLRVGRQGPTTVSALKLLERSGFARVERSDHDRRQTRVFLTERGRSIAAEMEPIVSHVEAIGLAGFDEEEVRTLKRFIVRIQRNLDANSKTRNPWAGWRTEQLAEEVGDVKPAPQKR